MIWEPEILITIQEVEAEATQQIQIPEPPLLKHSRYTSPSALHHDQYGHDEIVMSCLSHLSRWLKVSLLPNHHLGRAFVGSNRLCVSC